MRKLALVGIVVLVAGGALSLAFAGPTAKPQAAEVRIGALRLAPDEVASVSVAGPSPARSYVRTRQAAERQRGPDWKTRIADYPNKLLDLYTADGFLVIQWTRWKDPETAYETPPEPVEVHTFINLSEVVFCNVKADDDGRYRLRIKLAKAE
jgi:hypothetical protein